MNKVYLYQVMAEIKNEIGLMIAADRICLVHGKRLMDAVSKAENKLEIAIDLEGETIPKHKTITTSGNIPESIVFESDKDDKILINPKI